MLKYYDYLTRQFLNAKGIKKADFSSEIFVSEWGSWLEKLSIDIQKYYEFLLKTEFLPTKHFQVAEIGKSYLDSVSKLDGDLSIITPYILGFEQIGAGEIIKADFKVLKSKPFAIQKDAKKSIQVNSVSPKVKTFMTQNPYSFKEVKQWEDLPNSGKRDIIVGVYGKTSDKDRDIKIRRLEELKIKLEGSYEEAYAIDDGMYYYTIKSDRYSKKK